MDIKLELPNFINAEDFKPDLDAPRPICRCCLTSNKRMINVILLENEIRYLANIYVSPTDGLPQTLCYECCCLLQKAVMFKQKLIRAHELLQDYVCRSDPFPSDFQDPELVKYATPYLDATGVLVFDSGKGKLGFHRTLDHKSLYEKTELDSIDLPLDDEQNETGFSDYEDNLTLDEFRSNVTKLEDETMTEEDLATLLALPLPLEEDKKDKKKSKRKEDKVKKKKKKKEGRSIKTETLEEEKEQKTSIRQSIDIDPAKIRIITLNPEEQVKQREEESKKQSGRFPYSCHLCFKGFNFESKLQNHMFKHDPARGSYKCALCHMYLPTTYSFGVHMMIHTQRYQCVRCDVMMTNKTSIIDHYRREHEGICTLYECHLCGKISGNNKTHRGHLRNHHSGARPKCDLCDKTFVNADSLNQHLQIHTGAKNYSCFECGMKFRTRTRVKVHQLSHSDRKDHYCVECDASFKTFHSLRQHLLRSTKHRDEHSLKFNCEICPKRFQTSSSLRHHVSIQHEGARPHRCSKCPAALASRASLRKHERFVHSGLKPTTIASHVCDTCGKAFKSRSVLTNHVRTHTGEKPYACATCGRPFAQKSALRTHVNLVHLNVKRNNKVKPDQRSGCALVSWIKQPPTADTFFQQE